MKPAFIALIVLGQCFAGCGKKEQESSKPQEKVQPKSGSKTNAKKPATVLREFTTKGGVFASPAIGPDGILYFGGKDYFTQKVYAIKTSSLGPCAARMPNTPVAHRRNNLS